MANTDYIWPEVTIQICTYNRPTEIVRTIKALMSAVKYPKDKLKWLVCDDSSPEEYRIALASTKLFEALNIRIVTTKHNLGWGANVNNGMAAIDSDYIFFVEDDKLLYIKSNELNLKLGVALLEKEKHIGMLRYKGTAGTHVILHQMEADITEYGTDHVDGSCGIPERLTYCLLDSGSPSLYLYSHGPHLKHRRFHNFYGEYAEGLKLGRTEEAFCHQVKNKMKDKGAPCIAVLPQWILPYWEDIGKSYQHTEWDK